MKHLRLTEEQLSEITGRIKKNATMRENRILPAPGVDIDAIHVKTGTVRRKGDGVLMLVEHINQERLPMPVVEHRFHATRRWRFDLAWVELRIAAEVEGGVYSNGRHVRGKGYEADMNKYNEATIMGWKVLRFSTGQVKQRLAIQTLMRVFG